mmetsp:Transcript_26162/g.38705  ORF Transcript_26162/g.38705 Transcript_26162/m.38705 type:complete len:698 (+) Transcript_26162:372-2465(+)
MPTTSGSKRRPVPPVPPGSALRSPGTKKNSPVNTNHKSPGSVTYNLAIGTYLDHSRKSRTDSRSGRTQVSRTSTAQSNAYSAATTDTAGQRRRERRKKKRLPSILTFRRGERGRGKGDGHGNGHMGVTIASSDESGLTVKSKTDLLMEFCTLMNEFPCDDALSTTLHIACEKHYSSELIVDYLIAKGPSAITMKNAAGDLPLHSAMRDGNGNVNSTGVQHRVWDTLVKVYPKAVSVRNKEGSLPLHLACQSGGRNVYAIEELLRRYPQAVMEKTDMKIKFDKEALDYVGTSMGDDDNENGGGDGDGEHNDSVETVSFWSKMYFFSPTKSYDVDQDEPENTENESCFSPLHLAILNGASPDVIQSIISTNFKCVGMKTNQNRKAIDCAMYLDQQRDSADEDELPAAIKNSRPAIDIIKTFQSNQQLSQRLSAALQLASNRQILVSKRQLSSVKEFDANKQWRKLAHLIKFTHSLKTKINYLGPAIPHDASKVIIPSHYVPPAQLFHLCADTDLPIGFKRIRRAILSSQSTFVKTALLQNKLKFTEVEIESWDKHDDEIGIAVPNRGTDLKKIIGARRNCKYLMPKSGIVAANMAYEVETITEYNPHSFAIKKVTRNPDVPFGKSFECHVQTVFINKGFDNCRMISSVEAVFLGKPPMIAWKIKNGMYSGVTNFFVAKGEAIMEHSVVPSNEGINDEYA